MLKMHIQKHIVWSKSISKKRNFFWTKNLLADRSILDPSLEASHWLDEENFPRWPFSRRPHREPVVDVLRVMAIATPIVTIFTGMAPGNRESKAENIKKYIWKITRIYIYIRLYYIIFYIYIYTYDCIFVCSFSILKDTLTLKVGAIRGRSNTT